MHKNQIPLRVFMTMITILLSATVLAGQLPKDPCEVGLLPVPVKELLAQKLPSWRVLRLSELSAEEQELWLKRKDGKKCPGIAVGHFETKTRDAYAVVLIPSDLKTPDFQLVVVNLEKGAYQLKELIPPGPPANFPIVYSLPPGKYSDAERTSSVDLALDSFQVEWMFVRAILYYWKDGRYNELVVKD
jgi:hypothetical protein